MIVFLAGASGVIGSRLVPLLVGERHEVVGLTRSPSKAETLRALGATAVVCDVYDAQALRDVVVQARPQVVIHQLTDLPDDPRQLGEYGPANARIRHEGTANLLAAAHAAGDPRLIVQSIAWTLPGGGAASIAEFEHLVLNANGIVVRYGQWYGPGTYHRLAPPPPPRIHIDRAAQRTLEALTTTESVLTLAED